MRRVVDTFRRTTELSIRRYGSKKEKKRKRREKRRPTGRGRRRTDISLSVEVVSCPGPEASQLVLQRWLRAALPTSHGPSPFGTTTWCVYYYGRWSGVVPAQQRPQHRAPPQHKPPGHRASGSCQMGVHLQLLAAEGKEGHDETTLPLERVQVR